MHPKAPLEEGDTNFQRGPIRCMAPGESGVRRSKSLVLH